MWVYVACCVFGALYAAYRAFVGALPRILFVPPNNWRDKIKHVVEYPKPVYLSCGMKRLAYRRRLILASEQPAFYTNYTNSKLKIFPGDIENGSEFQLEMTRRAADDPNRRMIYGFFHPYAANGGGGERVLWQAVKATLLADDKNIAAIYVASDAKPLEIYAKVRDKFGISVDEARCVFIYLRRFPSWIKEWRRFSLAGQLIGLFFLGMEALYNLTPDVFVDTQGLPGCYSVIGSTLMIPIIAYVHYPIIQNDMFARLRVQLFGQVFTHLTDIKAVVKYFYWLSLYYWYMLLGALVLLTLCNGQFTYNHIRQGWLLTQGQIEIVYPPCGELGKENDAEKENLIVYVAQFRPEKRHDLVVDEYKQFLDANKSSLKVLEIPKLVFAGACRTADDTATLEGLRALVKEKDLELLVEFVVDCPYDELLALIGRAKFGVNAMWNEHFGIGVVEYIEGGAVPIVHASGGPYYDICTETPLVPIEEGKEEEEKSDKAVARNSVSDHPVWRNTKAFFFKSEHDPDIAATKDNAKFPALLELLGQMFVLDPALISELRLAEMRSAGKAGLERFSDLTFMKHWANAVALIDFAEKELRPLRGDVEQVY